MAGGVVTGVFAVMALAAPLRRPLRPGRVSRPPQLARPCGRPLSSAPPTCATTSSPGWSSAPGWPSRWSSSPPPSPWWSGVPLGLIVGLLRPAARPAPGPRHGRPVRLPQPAAGHRGRLRPARASSGQGVPAAALSISVIYVPQYFRVVRNHTLAVREEPFVDAARAMGARPRTVDRPATCRQRGPVGAGHLHRQRRRRRPHPGRPRLPRLRRAVPDRRVGPRHLPGHRRRGQRLLVDVALPGAGHPAPGHRPDPAGRGHQRRPQPPAAPGRHRDDGIRGRGRGPEAP